MFDTVEDVVPRSDLASKAVHLRPPGDAGLHVMTARIARDQRLEHIVVSRRMWTWTDQRHLSAEHIHELRKLVDIITPQPAPDARDARIVPPRRDDAGAVFHRCHCPEFQDAERFAIETITALRKKYGPGAVEPYQDRH